MVGAIRVRNRRGQFVDAPQFSASEAKHNFGQLLDTALSTGPVTITKQRKPTAVLISLDDYKVLTQVEDRALAVLSAEFDRRFELTPEEQLAAFAAASLRTPATRKPAAKRRSSRRA